MRDNEIRRKSGERYFGMIATAVPYFLEEFTNDPELPIIRLTRDEMYAVTWKMPKTYQELVLKIKARVIVHHQYELAPTQLVMALLEAAIQSHRIDFGDEMEQVK